VDFDPAARGDINRLPLPVPVEPLRPRITQKQQDVRMPFDVTTSTPSEWYATSSVGLWARTPAFEITVVESARAALTFAIVGASMVSRPWARKTSRPIAGKSGDT